MGQVNRCNAQGDITVSQDQQDGHCRLVLWKREYSIGTEVAWLVLCGECEERALRLPSKVLKGALYQARRHVLLEENVAISNS